jgi:glycosyltransferase involved in cell wall biosynthesis
LHPVKAIPVLLQAIALIRMEREDIVVDIAGDGDPRFISQLHKKVNELGINDFVLWHGHVDEKKKIKLFTEATCFVLLSYHENFGLAAAEALASGLPVVLSDQVGIAPDVIHYQAGEVIDVDDPVAAARAIIRVIDSKLNNQYRKQAYQLAHDRYGINSFTSGLVSMYQSVLNK